MKITRKKRRLTVEERAAQKTNPTHLADVADRMERFGSVAQLTDRILNPKVSELRIVENPLPYPGWTDGKVVWLNETVLPPINEKVDVATLTTWMGVNYHELGHTLNSPRQTSALIKLIRKAAEREPDRFRGTLQKVENLVEDQRQERLMIKRYRFLAPYLMAATEKFVIPVSNDLAEQALKTGHQTTARNRLGQVWPLLAGRTWLPDRVRQASLDAFPGDGLEVARIIGEYQRLPDVANNDAGEAFDLLVDLHDLLETGDQPWLGQAELGCGDTFRNGGQPKPAEAGDAGDDGDGDPAPSAGSAGDTALNPADASDGDGDGASDGDGDGASDGAGAGASTGAGNGDGDEGKGEPSRISDASPHIDIVNLATQIAQDVRQARHDNAEFKDHLDRVSKAVNVDKGSGETGLPMNDSIRQVVADGRSRGAAHRLSATFRKFIDAAMPHWDFEVDSGRLNAGRFLTQSNDWDTMFDRYEEGLLDDVTLDVTLLLDVSSSMSNYAAHKDKGDPYDFRTNVSRRTGMWPTFTEMYEAGYRTLIDEAATAAWVIRRAVASADGMSTVVTYNGSAKLMAPTGSRPHSTKIDVPHASGGTDPSEAIEATYRRLKGVNAAHKVVVALTDGDWYEGGAVMRKISRSGVTTVGVLVTSSPDMVDNAQRSQVYGKRMGVDHFAVITNPMDMVKLFEEVVSASLDQVMTNGGVIV